MASEVEICNNALMQLGAEDLLTALTDDTSPGRACNAMYSIVRDEVLTNFAWNSAMKQAQLAPLVETPTYDFTYAFQLPPDCLRVIKIGAQNSSTSVYRPTDLFAYNRWEEVAWRRFGRKIYANVSPLFISYVAKITDPNDMDPALRDAIAARLAMKIAYKITGSRTKEESMRQLFREVLDEAMVTNSLEGSTEAYTALQGVVVR